MSYIVKIRIAALKKKIATDLICRDLLFYFMDISLPL